MPLGGRGHMALLFGLEKTQRREKSGLKNFCIPIFYTVEQDEPYKIPVTSLSRDFMTIFEQCE